MHNILRRVLVGTVILSCAAGMLARSDEARSRAAVARLISESGADATVAFRTLDAPGGPPRLELLIQPDVALIAPIARVLFDETQAAPSPQPGRQRP